MLSNPKIQYNQPMTKYVYNKAVRLTKKRKALLAALPFFAKLLKIDNYNVTIALNFKHNFTELFQVYAQVYHVNTHRINIEFDANINNAISLQVLAHEMVHVKQYVTGKLAEDSEGFQLWRGKRVSENLSYTQEPWEVEAMRNESLMTHKYIEYRDSPKGKK